MTLNTAGPMTVQGVGMALSGAAAEFAGVQATVAGAGVLGTLCCVLLAVEARRTEGGGKLGLSGGGTERRDGADQDVTGR